MSPPSRCFSRFRALTERDRSRGAAAPRGGAGPRDLVVPGAPGMGSVGDGCVWPGKRSALAARTRLREGRGACRIPSRGCSGPVGPCRSCPAQERRRSCAPPWDVATPLVPDFWCPSAWFRSVARSDRGACRGFIRPERLCWAGREGLARSRQAGPAGHPRGESFGLTCGFSDRLVADFQSRAIARSLIRNSRGCSASVGYVARSQRAREGRGSLAQTELLDFLPGAP